MKTHDHIAIQVFDDMIQTKNIDDAVRECELFLSFFDDEHSGTYIDHLRDTLQRLKVQRSADIREKLLVIANIEEPIYTPPLM